MISVVYEHPDMMFSSVLTSINYKSRSMEEILAPVKILHEKFRDIQHSEKENGEVNWIMGQVNKLALGNVPMKVLKEEIEKIVNG